MVRLYDRPTRPSTRSSRASTRAPGMQQARTSELLFSIADLVSYASTFTTLRPGDLIVTGTMSGVASAREDQPFLKDGQVVTVTIEGIGSCRNEFYAEA